MKRTSVAFAFCMSFALPVTAQVSDEARAHIKCFANLTQGLLTPEGGYRFGYLAKVITGVTFKDGIETTNPDQIAA
tara:strand:- start:318 stop:545 length:228 start_codon:yes stop_codon:yes gene_type:complete